MVPELGGTGHGRLPVVVVGAGPYGLATAAWLAAADVTTRVFGEPMESWRTHMPDGMFLKSVPTASSISAPEGGHRFADFRAARGGPPVGDTYPIPVEEFIAYGRWFQERRVPDVERTAVRDVRAADGGFGVTLDSGEEIIAGAVVMAGGLAPYAYSRRASPPTRATTPTSPGSPADGSRSSARASRRWRARPCSTSRAPGPR
ncbi:hypothetical protein [Streptomyces sp. SS]|uniref:hypothetical protein n=1 Tax=Streptomyces sp. SS TaxID=260742 RepID=UPI00307AA38B